MPAVSPVTLHEREIVEHVVPPGDAVTVYPVIVLPPVLAGAVQETLAPSEIAVADGLRGALGALLTVINCWTWDPAEYVASAVLFALSTHEPMALNVTMPALIVQILDEPVSTVMAGVSDDVEAAAGVYVSPTFAAESEEVKLNVCALSTTNIFCWTCTAAP